MDKTTALKVLTKHYNAPYEGTFTSATSGDLIQDILWDRDWETIQDNSLSLL